MTSELTVLTTEGYDAAIRLAEKLVESGFLPRAIQKPAQALAIILAGQEYGIPPMQALRQIHVVEGKPVLSAELMLSLFKRRGGKATWLESTDQKAVLWLKHPNGDEHTEAFTWQDAVRAGVATKDNWRKYPKAMLRARCGSAGIRALGEAGGFYDPDELGVVTDPVGLADTQKALEVAPEPRPLAQAAPGRVAPPESSPVSTGQAPGQPSALTARTTENTATSASAASPPGREPGEDDAAFDPITGEVEPESEEDVNDLVWCNSWNSHAETWEPVRQEPRITPTMLRHIHVLRDELGHQVDLRRTNRATGKQEIVPDGRYRQQLIRNFGKERSSELSIREAQRAIDWLETLREKLMRRVADVGVRIADGLAELEARDSAESK